MLEIAYLLVFFISCAYALVTYFLAFFMDYQMSPLPFGILMLGVVFYYFIGKTGGFRTTSKSFKSTFVKTFFLFFLPGIILTILYQGEKAVPALSAATPYLIVFLTSSVLLLQLLRHTSGTNDQKKFEKFQRKQAFAFFLVTFLGTVCKLFEISFYLINRFLIRPVALVFAGLFGTMSQGVAHGDIFGKGGFLDSVNSQVQENNPQNLQDVIGQTRPLDSTVTEETIAQPVSRTFTIVVTIVIAIILIVILVLILTGIKKERKKTIVIHEEREDSIEDDVITTKLKKHFAPPDIQIRYCYRQFMKKSIYENHGLKDSDTTQDISRKYLKKQMYKQNTKAPSSQQLETTSALTELYRKTRYSSEPASKEDAALMKKLIKHC